LALQYFPKRGRAWDDVRPGLRTVGFEGRVTIAFVVLEDEVVIVRIFYGGRDFEALLRGASD
jgi:plasmid stabilization system protein ParE